MNKTPQQLQGQPLHLPVLLNAVLGVLKPQKGELYLDLTAGYGGHAKQVIAAIGDAHLATLVDRDNYAIAALQPIKATGARLIHQDYATAAANLYRAGEQFDMVLLDLGVSSPQLDIADRGFSFLQDGPLDMRMDQQGTGFTAADICNKASLDELVRILREYGEEPHAHKIARAIMAARPLKTTSQLADAVLKTHRGPWQKSHPATRTFQALRIAVNNELGQLNDTLKRVPDLLKPGGRVAVISFHSLEDRIVKRFFKEEQGAGYEARLQTLTKQAISGADQDAHNPRARSAKLRAAVNIK